MERREYPYLVILGLPVLVLVSGLFLEGAVQLGDVQPRVVEQVAVLFVLWVLALSLFDSFVAKMIVRAHRI